ncbi:MAG TPA: T9SS type A sorting domain-containing protein [Candidatus Kapabacteria bacterium]|jgi:hypothetical protein|nr:T9SS type A sorting domain-containing protein [Candidatus Kapabacteria bacterium]
MKITYLVLLTVAAITIASIANAQSVPADFVVQVEASAQLTPPELLLHWKSDSRAQHYYISRRILGDNTWNLIKTLPGADTSYLDADAQIGIGYEYKILDSTKTDSVYAAQGFIAAGIAVNPPDPSTVILIVDKTYAVALKNEIDRLVTDLTLEGRHVIRHDVTRTDAVTSIQDSIYNDYNNDNTVQTVFLLGHVPVPYSGDLAPDGHTPGNGNHQGAWPADVYYGNFGTSWSDVSVSDSTGQDPRNWNGIGDGKFDQSAIEVQMDLEVGRVDLYGLPSFPLSDTELLRNYLNRDHAFRNGGMKAPTRALIDDNFGIIGENAPRSWDVPASNGWRNFPPLVGISNVTDFKTVSTANDWFGYLDTAEYLWAYGCGAGSWASCNGVGVTTQFVSPGAKAIFYMLFGSFFGDWDRPDALTKAPLGTDYALESCWAGRPAWFFHPLGIGGTFGYCAKLSQSVTGGFEYSSDYKHFLLISDYVVTPSIEGVHVALMGDPTLRMQYLSDPPSALSASIVGNAVKLTWAPPTIAVPGYNIYRSSSSAGTFTKINTALVTSPSFTDASPMNDSNIYFVRAAGITPTASGSFVNESEGVMQGVNVTVSGVRNISEQSASRLKAIQNGNFIDITLSQASFSAERISIIDIAGREVEVIANADLLPGTYSYHVNAASFSEGVYFVRMASSNGIISTKFILTR